MCNLTPYKGKPSILYNDLAASIDSQLEGPVRALLVIREDCGFRIQAVHDGESVLDIKRDLLNHLNEYPHTDEWLIQVKDSIEQRLDGRARAQRTGAVSIPLPGGWT